jgi:small-conductance mechanosensitive channel
MIYGNLLAGIIILFGCILAAGLYIAGIRLRKRLEETEGSISKVMLSALGIPAVLTVLVVSVYTALRYVAVIPEIGLEILDSIYIQVLFIIIGALILAIFVKNLLELYAKNIASRTSSGFDDKLVHFLLSIYGYVIGIGTFFLLLSILKVDITPLLATGGVAGIIIGLAAQDTFGNFFSGAMIAADQPFREGDRIEILGVIGDVQSVGPRSTRIKTLDNQLVTIPNNILTENMLTNFALPDVTLKIRINIGVGYDSDIELVRRTLMEVAKQAVSDNMILDDPAPAIYFLEFGDSALMFQLLVWSDRYDNAFDVRNYLNTRIHAAFKSSGIEIPYPQMDIHMKNTPTIFK